MVNQNNLDADNEFGSRLDALRRLAGNRRPYAYNFRRTHTSQQILDHNPHIIGNTVRVAGRVTAIRQHRDISFIDLHDNDGRIQLVVSQNPHPPNPEAQEVLQLLHRGDFLGVRGDVIRTTSGEISVCVADAEILSKSLRPLPQNRELTPEFRYRQRYADLAINPEVRETFLLRSKIVREMRNFLERRGFVELETPTLQPIYGGALARPFETHHNTLNRKLYLRISNELYLKRLIVGGFERVYEIVRDFRNEGIDTTHNPEFTQMEFYQAYIDYRELMRIAERMTVYIARRVLGTTYIRYGDHEIDLAPPWRRMTMFEALQQLAGIDVEQISYEELRNLASRHNIEHQNMSRGEIIAALFDELVQGQLIQPTFIFDYPIETSPLAKIHRSDPRFVERFELFIAGQEFANAYTELNDPIDQLRRFNQQAQARAAGNEEAHPIDRDFVRALEYGMPPTGGFGIGIDRLCMLLLNKQSIKDVILFPQLREEEEEVELVSEIAERGEN